MPKNHKLVNNEKDKQIRESHIDTIIKNDNKLLETIENIGSKAVQPNPLPIPKRHLDNSNDTNESERKEIATEINNTNSPEKDSQQEMNNLNLGNTNSM